MITKKKAETLMLDWFGSEPLMYFDEVIAKFRNFRKKRFRNVFLGFTQQITTNGILLNEKRIRMMNYEQTLF
ncbi:hypothetical protein [Odoribacter sp. Z80]|uniref:hypothetical protein n=1 Tax=Odoribacter sp. Z80 TaxID=2304575 RepID=UPI001379D2FE|nr:hypothetical protein [Odoribacter sp. Z80]NCE72401.1 hypothetical protein [Odoribacter sp. Z80]